MSLDMKIEKSTDSKKSVSEELLDAYLEKAVKLTRYKGPLTSNIALSKEVKKEEWQGIKLEDVQKRQETHAAVVKEAEEKTATKHKVGYAIGINSTPAMAAACVSIMTSIPPLGLSAVVGVTAGACAIAGVSSGFPEGFPTTLGVVSAVLAGPAAVDFICHGSSKEEYAAFDNYVEVKHAQMALKKLAKNLEKQEAKEKETGKGVKAAVLAKAGYAR